MKKYCRPHVWQRAAGILLFLLAACAPGSDGGYIFRVKVTDAAGQPVEQARVELAVNGNFAVLSDTTVSNGYAIIEIDGTRRGKLARLAVSAPGYKPYSQYVNLLEGALPAQIVLEKDAPAEPAASPESVPGAPPVVSPTATPSPLPSPSPSPSPSPINTPLPAPTAAPTPTPFPSATPAPLAQAVYRPLYVYAAPDINEPAVGTLAFQASAVIVGRAANAEWIEVITPQGIRGWLLPCSVAVSGVSDWSIFPVTWPGTVVAYRCSDTIPPALGSSD